MRNPRSLTPLVAPISYQQWAVRRLAGELTLDDLSRWSWSAIRHMRARGAHSAMASFLFMLPHRADASGYVCDLLEDSAYWLGACERTLQRARQTLVKEGWLKRVTDPVEAKLHRPVDVYCAQGKVFSAATVAMYSMRFPSPDSFEPMYPMEFRSADEYDMEPHHRPARAGAPPQMPSLG